MVRYRYAVRKTALLALLVAVSLGLPLSASPAPSRSNGVLADLLTEAIKQEQLSLKAKDINHVGYGLSASQTLLDTAQATAEASGPAKAIPLIKKAIALDQKAAAAPTKAKAFLRRAIAAKKAALALALKK